MNIMEGNDESNIMFYVFSNTWNNIVTLGVLSHEQNPFLMSTPSHLVIFFER